MLQRSAARERGCGFVLVCPFDLRTPVNGCRLPFQFSCQSARVPGLPSALPHSDRLYRPHHMRLASFHLAFFSSALEPFLAGDSSGWGKLRCRSAAAPLPVLQARSGEHSMTEARPSFFYFLFLFFLNSRRAWQPTKQTWPRSPIFRNRVNDERGLRDGRCPG